jgi:putative ABC transport system ATP-binding protein
VKNISILDNLLLSLYLSKNKEDKKRAIELLEQVGLGHQINSKPNNLSQGEQQRAAIALAVIKNPSVILADEPTSSLDDINCKKITSLLKEQAASTNAQLIIITHDQRLKSQFDKSITL